MDPFTIAQLIQVGLNVAVRVISVIRENNGSFTIIEYVQGTSDLNKETLAAAEKFLQNNPPVAVPPK
jgi:hypothetical protein